MKCSKCGKPVKINTKTKFDDDKQFKKFRVLCKSCRDTIYSDLTKSAEEESVQAQRKEDTKMKKRGYTYKVNYWIHPIEGGSDYQRTMYQNYKPAKEDIAKYLRESCVKDDYTVIEL